MEPPAKRLRILQPVEVDEENEAFISAKQRQQRKFKGRLESIFEKYGNMHESMSDEVDMTTNSVVVDRGHLRRLNRQVGRKETMLLATLGLITADEPEGVSEEEGEKEDSADELAPPQLPKSKGRQAEEDSDNNPPILHQPNTTATSMAQFGVQQTPSTPNPAANLLQVMQFPQTPAGLQAQTSFYTTLAQTINQAVQQAVAPLFSGLLPYAPNVPLPFANTLPAPVTPIAVSDKIAPATDPKWFFPPLSARSRKDTVAQSSPVPASGETPRLEDAAVQHVERIASQEAQEKESESVPMTSSEAPQIPETPPMSSDRRRHDGSAIRPRRSSPRVEIQKRRVGSNMKYCFTQEDDVYISKSKLLHKHTWAEIRDGKVKWKGWPLTAFQNRWDQGLKGKQLHLEPLTVCSGGRVQGNDRSPVERVSDSPVRSHHLPTPSSLDHEDSHEEARGLTHDQGSGNALPPRAHFDDDERELLSLAGADLEQEQPPVNNDDNTIYLTSEDFILPSIERIECVNDDARQHDLPTAKQPPSIDLQTGPVLSSPTSTRKRKPPPIKYEVLSDSEAEDKGVEFRDLGVDVFTTSAAFFVCNICQKSFQSAKNLVRHQDNPCNMHDKALQRSPSIDLVGDDDSQAPATTYIKRESSTPTASFLLNTSAFRTPKALPYRSDLDSSGSRSTSKVDRKTFRKQVKQSWTRKGTPAPKSVAKRKSFHTLPRKRAWVDDDGDEDELAM
ncbi:hypothetical protein EJ02DRAFT_433828 [Clathrospora elynae]|uniref:C2H2-type domain-containing protein n=1 Tax=Clathrospora elynae TaxID=706981 RepID=A0A6A5SS00_9PLEO|nr:hypothetical protein EJ02DRAFT_433828 [Clathrospora elynae]